MTTIDLVKYATEVHALSRAKGWWDPPHTPDAPHVREAKLALIHSELSEALECIRDGQLTVEYVDQFANQPEHPVHYKPVGLPIELADVVIRCLDYCVAYGVDPTPRPLTRDLPYGHGVGYGVEFAAAHLFKTHQLVSLGEVAEVIENCQDMARGLGIDLDAAIQTKHQYNQTRTFKHGGKSI